MQNYREKKMFSEHAHTTSQFGSDPSLSTHTCYILVSQTHTLLFILLHPTCRQKRDRQRVVHIYVSLSGRRGLLSPMECLAHKTSKEYNIRRFEHVCYGNPRITQWTQMLMHTPVKSIMYSLCNSSGVGDSHVEGTGDMLEEN